MRQDSHDTTRGEARSWRQGLFAVPSLDASEFTRLVYAAFSETSAIPLSQHPGADSLRSKSFVIPVCFRANMLK